MWNVELFVSSSGQCPVEHLLESLTYPKLKAKVLRNLDLLEIFGINLREPYVKKLKDTRGSMFELRSIQGNHHVRIFFIFSSQKRIVLLHGFVKKQSKTPRKEIDLAFHYKKECEYRYGK